MRECLTGVGLTDFLAFMVWADDIGSLPAAWSYIADQFYPCSLRVFYMTLVVCKDTYLNHTYNILEI